ncbi:MAG TPA: DUF2726 domain-containing protein [Syntrophomonadaceae bacterium]|nr:DUF2726 domain-containing protein [Syntrophomonadaceae bacterium]
MPQIIGVAIMVLIIYLINDWVRKITAGTHGSNKSQPQGDVIDITNAWIDLNDMPYSRKSQFLTPAENLLYKLLKDILSGSGYVVLPKTRLAEVLDLKPQSPHQPEYLRRIRERSCDFLICREPGTIPELMVMVESRQETASVQQSRAFAQRAAGAAGFPLVIINLDNAPDENTLHRILTRAGLSY